MCILISIRCFHLHTARLIYLYVDKGMLQVDISSGQSHPPRRNITPSTLISGIVIFSPYLDIEQTLKVTISYFNTQSHE